MEIFTSVIFRMAVLFSFMLIGFVMRRGELLPKNSAEVFSKLENRILMPAVVINTFSANCTAENIADKWTFIAYSAAVLAFCVAVGFAVSHFLSKEEYLRKIYRYSVSVSNFGFVGTAMVQGIYGDGSIELFDYLMFTLPLNLFTYSVGIAWLMPDDRAGSRRSVFNPIFVSLFIGAAMGLLGLSDTGFVGTVISDAAQCMSPVAMLLTGFVIGGYKLGELLSRRRTYIVTAVRLVLLPASAVSALRLFGAPDEIVIAALCANAMPLGLNTVIIPSAYGKPTDTGASLALVSQLASVVTVPLMFRLFSGL